MSDAMHDYFLWLFHPLLRQYKEPDLGSVSSIDWSLGIGWGQAVLPMQSGAVYILSRQQRTQRKSP